MENQRYMGRCENIQYTWGGFPGKEKRTEKKSI